MADYLHFFNLSQAKQPNFLRKQFITLQFNERDKDKICQSDQGGQ